MMTDQEIFDQLSAPFPTEMIEWRVGSITKDGTKGMALAYITSRAVQDRFDTVCGPGGWQAEHYEAGGNRLACKIGVHMSCGWVWKSDGAGETDFEAEKGAFSSALKRAAVLFGVGRYLYDMPAPWVALDNKRIPDAEMKKLNDVHDDFAQKAGWGMRAGIQAYKLANQMVRHFVTDSATAQEFKTVNASMIAQLPVAMRKHLNDTLDRIGASNHEAA